MKKFKFSCYLVLILLCFSCSKDQFVNPPGRLNEDSSPFNLISPKIKIAVISDVHYLDPSLMPDDYLTSTDFQSAMAGDRKIIELSDPIFKKVISEMAVEKPDILLVTGDLTREGEKVSHESVRDFLQQLENTGIKVYVIPGNNDINNSDAVTFKTSPPLSVANITPGDFEAIYGNFGYNEALYRDPNSLSYICQPNDNIWILGIDACKYTLDDGSYEVSGAINPATLVWIQEKMEEANSMNITVLAMMHYGIIEHYTGQKTLEPLIKSSKDNAVALMNSGLKLIFTGHYHATDVVEFTNEGKTLTDIQTGSLVTPPSPFRIMTLDDNFIKIDTRRVTDIDAELPGDQDFLTYCNSALNERLYSFFYMVLVYMFSVPESEAELAAPVCVTACKAYINGDERISSAEAEEIDELVPNVPSFPPIGSILYSWWTDLPPGDNKLHIKLK